MASKLLRRPKPGAEKPLAGSVPHLPVPRTFPPPREYLALQAWNAFLRSPRTLDLEVARKEDAPEDTIFRAFDGHWACMSSLHDGHPFRGYYEKFVKDHNHGIAAK